MPEADSNGAATDLLAFAAPLIGMLADIWPRNARPQSLGIMTDGSGILFCPDLPSPEEPGWAGRVLAERTGRVELHPFAPRSSWAWLSGLETPERLQ